MLFLCQEQSYRRGVRCACQATEKPTAPAGLGPFTTSLLPAPLLVALQNPGTRIWAPSPNFVPWTFGPARAGFVTQHLVLFAPRGVLPAAVVIAGCDFGMFCRESNHMWFWIKWKLSTKTFCPRGIQILNVLLITVCKTFRKIYGNTFREKKSHYSCLKILFRYLNFMNHPVWPNFLTLILWSRMEVHGAWT